MSRVAFVPARGGSKRLPGKNLAMLGGKSLVERATQTALSCSYFDQVIVSTDSSEIAEKVGSHPKLSVDYRKASLATDTATVLQATLDFVESSSNGIERIGVLLPTCPFRSVGDLDRCFELMTDGVDFVVSVVEYDFPWEMALGIDETGFSNPLVNPSPLVTGNTRSQDRRKVFHPNGCLYLGRVNALLRERTFFGPKLKVHVMNEIQSWDIDEEVDLTIARFLLEAGIVSE